MQITRVFTLALCATIVLTGCGPMGGSEYTPEEEPDPNDSTETGDEPPILVDPAPAEPPPPDLPPAEPELPSFVEILDRVEVVVKGLTMHIIAFDHDGKRIAKITQRLTWPNVSITSVFEDGSSAAVRVWALDTYFADRDKWSEEASFHRGSLLPADELLERIAAIEAMLAATDPKMEEGWWSCGMQTVGAFAACFADVALVPACPKAVRSASCKCHKAKYPEEALQGPCRRHR